MRFCNTPQTLLSCWKPNLSPATLRMADSSCFDSTLITLVGIVDCGTWLHKHQVSAASFDTACAIETISDLLKVGHWSVVCYQATFKLVLDFQCQKDYAVLTSKKGLICCKLIQLYLCQNLAKSANIIQRYCKNKKGWRFFETQYTNE